ncbi:MAG: hypothetical protein JKX69_15715 [Rhodobacteraceae bacterium]|nr:hypothetical protein [Paracoccaceae bacterium]
MSSAEVVAREDLKMWVMLNTAMGDIFDISVFRQRLGESETLDVVGRSNIIKAHYFPAADMTLFENTLRRTFVTWKLGRTNQL